ncbi:MAG: single-stranded DNA-binding protein [Candidatus Pacebacteria bacterium]|nr:single-stranded DNA-binding protein [Candidatus Paceibacterota bacterium]MDR3582928.1 single-stranded DNA-binding protein [Candidatus Paceibacterota bacterium]
MNVNKVMLVGRLTRDPEVRTTPSGQTVASVSLATSHTWKDKNGQKQEKTEFHNLVLWGRLGEIAGQYLIKGQEAYFEGRLQTTKYSDKSGVDRYRTDIVVENMQLGAKPRSAYESGAGNFAPAGNNYNTPQNPAPARPQAAPAPEVPAEQLPTIDLDEEEEVRIEDVPF